MKTKFLLFLSILFFSAFSVYAQDGQKRINKITDDDNSKYTNIGNIGLTLTNFGMYGNGFSGTWPKQPSCEYPLGSGIEHIFAGGLWVGGYISKDPSINGSKTGPFVTTGAVDKSSVSSRGGGFEYTNLPGSRIVERSSLLTSKNFNPQAVSHQDFVMDFVDTNRVLVGSSNEPIPDHTPLGIAVHQEAYAWNYTFANFFVIMNYWIKNVTDKYLDSVFVGLWTDTVIRNTIVSPPGTSNFFTHGGNGYSDSLRIGYEFDSNGDVGFTDSYVGVQYLGSTPEKNGANFVSWTHSNTSDVIYFTPMDDMQRYAKMNGFFADGIRLQNINPANLQAPSNRSILMTAGPFSQIAPGDSINVSFAIVCAKKYGTDLASLDTKEEKKNLFSNAGWALRAYNGEDRNGNGVLDPGEDLDGDGKIKRFILPAPPASPEIKVVPEDRKVAIYWDKHAEESIDPISSKKDFEGYRLYRTNAGYDLTATQDVLGSLVLLSEFDSLNNSVGYNTGFSKVRLNEPVTFPGDTNKYYYKFEIDNLLNGWQYTYSVTAFDKGDPGNDLESLESSVLASSRRVIPGTPATSDKNVQIGVYPNPYYGSAYWDGSSERLRKIYFYNLPAKCEITIYTLAGDIVKRIQHDSNSNGSDLRWFETYAKDGKQIMSGGEHAWDIISDNDQAIASGLYLFTVKDSNTGEIKTGKFLIIK
ncbi:MAG: hypothetical protein HF314_00300 [Ignavibacteria bacterium]|nr:hypothetical protein [Ignavibacteria bacterium]MCU7501491.1 hypothetical protein [Ignavibacteria bacterium]MCU7515993.1 hypothetical protein [Ignavibacteria bacterium]